MINEEYNFDSDREAAKDADRAIRTWERKVIIGLSGALITAFTVWAGVVYSSSQQVVSELRAVRSEMAADRLENQQYRTLMERRVTIIEQRQLFLLQQMRKQVEEMVDES